MSFSPPGAAPKGPQVAVNLEVALLWSIPVRSWVLHRGVASPGANSCDLSLIHARAGQSSHSLQFLGENNIIYNKYRQIYNPPSRGFPLPSFKDSSTDVY